MRRTRRAVCGVRGVRCAAYGECGVRRTGRVVCGERGVRCAAKRVRPGGAYGRDRCGRARCAARSLRMAKRRVPCRSSLCAQVSWYHPVSRITLAPVTAYEARAAPHTLRYRRSAQSRRLHPDSRRLGSGRTPAGRTAHHTQRRGLNHAHRRQTAPHTAPTDCARAGAAAMYGAQQARHYGPRQHNKTDRRPTVYHGSASPRDGTSRRDSLHRFVRRPGSARAAPVSAPCVMPCVALCGGAMRDAVCSVVCR